MGIYRVDMSWVLAIYSVSVQKKVPTYEALVGYFRCLGYFAPKIYYVNTQQVFISENVRPSIQYTSISNITHLYAEIRTQLEFRG